LESIRVSIHIPANSSLRLGWAYFRESLIEYESQITNLKFEISNQSCPNDAQKWEFSSASDGFHWGQLSAPN